MMTFKCNYSFINLGLALVLLYSSCVVFADNSSVSVTPNRLSADTFTLNQLSKIDTAVLEGNRPSYTFYIPMPSQWQVNSIDLNLVIDFSPLLLNSSSLTVMVGDTPLDSIKLDSSKEQPMLWKVTIPKASMTKQLTTVRLVGYMKLSDDICQDIENQSNWITLSGRSSITYHYAAQQANWDLLDFPYPFIHKDAPFIDNITFYLPSNMSVADFAPYFKLANTLAKQASWRGVDISTLSIDALSSSQPDFPSVIIGTPKTIDFSLLGTPDSLQLKEGVWLNHDGIPLANDKGFIWLKSLSDKPLLIISANSKKGLAIAVESINTNQMHFMVNNASFFIATPISASIKQINNQTITSFHSMGYKDNVVFGSGQSQLNYQFNLPQSFTNQPAKLTLQYSHSPFLQKDKASTLSVLLNGFPVNGTVLKPDSAQIKTFELELPQKQLLLGKNTLTLTFNLMLANTFCSRDYLSQAWGTIYDTSSLQFYPTDNPLKDQIQLYPALMDGEVFVGLPDDVSFYQDTQLINNMIDFAMTLPNASVLNVMDSKSMTHQMGDNNSIYLAQGMTDLPAIDTLKNAFSSLVSHLTMTSNLTLRSIDKSLFINAFQKPQDVGFISINSTASHQNATQLTLYGFTPRELSLALKLLNNSYKLGLLSGNLGVSFQNGTFTSLSSHEIEDTIQKEIAVKRVSQATINYALYSLGGLLLLIVIYLIRRVWRRA